MGRPMWRLGFEGLQRRLPSEVVHAQTPAPSLRLQLEGNGAIFGRQCRLQESASRSHSRHGLHPLLAWLFPGRLCVVLWADAPASLDVVFWLVVLLSDCRAIRAHLLLPAHCR